MTRNGFPDSHSFPLPCLPIHIIVTYSHSHDSIPIQNSYVAKKQMQNTTRSKLCNLVLKQLNSSSDLKHLLPKNILSMSLFTKSQSSCHFGILLCRNSKLFVESTFGLLCCLGPPNSAMMQTAVINGNYFPWEWGLFPLPPRSLPIHITIPTIDSMSVPFPRDSHSHGHLYYRL